MERRVRKRSKRRKRNKLVVIWIIIFIVTIGFFGRKINMNNLFQEDTVSAISIQNGLEIIGTNHPTSKEISKRIKEEESRKLEVQREEDEVKRRQEENKDKKIAYLTFDDGPSSKSTPIILDVLKKYNIKATFFVVGTMVEENPEILKKIYGDGHQIGNHTYSHNYGYIYKNPKNFMDDIYKLEKLIKSIVGNEFDSKIIRFPGGSFEAKKDPMKKAAFNAGYRYFDWNALNGDAEGGNFPEKHLINRLKETVMGKKKIIILMHDTDQKITTAKSLEKSIEFLLSEGYEFHILDKNFSWE